MKERHTKTSDKLAEQGQELIFPDISPSRSISGIMRSIEPLIAEYQGMGFCLADIHFEINKIKKLSFSVFKNALYRERNRVSTGDRKLEIKTEPKKGRATEIDSILDALSSAK